MKNNLFFKGMFISALFIMNFVNARGRAPQQIQQIHFRQIMSNNWDSSMQAYLNNSWNLFTDAQKRAILQRMADQGLLSEDEIQNWPMNVIPQKSYGG